MKKSFILILAAAVALVAVSCGNNNSKKKAVDETDREEVEVSARETSAPVQEPEKKMEPKKWYEQDFSLTEKMYVGSAGITRTYARKGNILICMVEGSGATNLFVCTDSTRTHYLVGNNTGKYGKTGEKTGFTSVDDAIYKYLKSQMGETVLGKTFRKGEEGTTTRDTTIFGRPAYVITKDMTEKNAVVEVSGRAIMYIDQELGIPFYKWSSIKTNGKLTTEGKAFEVTAFSTEPTYEGLIMSLEGLEEVRK